MYNVLILKMEKRRDLQSTALDNANHFMQAFSLKYKRYRKRENEYSFDGRTVDFEEVFQTILPYEEQVLFNMEIEPAYTADDFEKAAAVFMSFGKYCNYYDRPEDNPYNAKDTLKRRKRGTFDSNQKMYIAPGGLKKVFVGRCTGASTDYGIHVVSFMMRDYLLDNGIDEDYLKPVYQKDGSIWAYYLDGEQHLLPSMALLNDISDITWKDGNANVIGKIDEKDRGKSLWNDFQKSLNIGIYPRTNRWEIQSEAAAALGEVNRTEDFYLDTRYTVVGKRLFELIRAKEPRIIKTSHPIFSADFHAEIKAGGIIEKVYG